MIPMTLFTFITIKKILGRTLGFLLPWDNIFKFQIIANPQLVYHGVLGSNPDRDQARDAIHLQRAYSHNGSSSSSPALSESGQTS
jgi:hypothetical protein